jgi:formate dehydrogenase major subunit
MPKISFLLDGRGVEIDAGATILEAAKQQGVEIPTLCHDPRLKPTAACRLCLVEVEGVREPMPACATRVIEGMVVRTMTDDIITLRRSALELLLSDHYGDCLAPCSRACPAGIDIQGYLSHIANGQYREALKLIKETNPLPLVCGRVCPGFCEAKCRRNLVDEPIAINMLKRFVTDYDIENNEPYLPQPKPATGRKVAIIGAGPAGLTAAYYLALEGHEVSIFDAHPKLGGMLRYGIPEYRLPKAILDREIGAITRLCHDVYCNVSLGKDFSLEVLKAMRYDAIFLGIGAWANQRMNIDGEDLPGIFSGIDFLNDVAQGKEIAIGDKIAVIGGGNTAVDAARSALRLGAKEVTIVYRRSREEMPAHTDEITQAEEEGIQIQFLTSPLRFSGQNGRVNAMECIQMALGEPDSSNRRKPEPIADSEFTIEVNNVIMAVGQTFDLPSLNSSQLVTTRRGYLSISEKTMETSVAGVFAGGDCASGPATAVEAIGAGRKAAISINQYLNGDPVVGERKPYDCSKGELEEVDVNDYESVEHMPRVKMPALGPNERKESFTEIELGLSEEMAKKEAERCLACGCQDVFECQLRKLATEYQVDDSHHAGYRRHLSMNENEHPHILRDPNKCILCGRCIRICDEVMGIGAWGFTSRGFGTKVEPALGMPLCETNCISCSQCVSTCPTGALTTKVNLPKPGPWQLEAVSTICPYCGIGCNLKINTVGNKIVKVTSALNSTVNNGNLCKKGAFKPISPEERRRLRTPLIKRDGSLIESGWEEAIALAGQGLRQIRKRVGGQQTAVLVSPNLTNEEGYLAQKLARMALKTNNVDNVSAPVAGEELRHAFGSNASTCSYDDLLNSDLIVVFDCELTEDYPIIALKVREAVAKGSQLINFSRRANSMDPLASISLKVNPRISLGILRSMLNYIITYDLVDDDFVHYRATGFERLAHEMRMYTIEKIADELWLKPSRIIQAIQLYIRAQRPVIVVNTDTITPTELTLLSNLALITGNVGRHGAGIIALRGAGNAQGLIDMGVTPDYLPGQQSVRSDTVKRRFDKAWGKPIPTDKGRNAVGIVQDIEVGRIQGLLVLGDMANNIGDAIFEGPAFSVLMDTVMPEKPPYPDVVLPSATFVESEGSYTNCEHRIQRLQRAILPLAGMENWEVISALSTALGYAMHYRKVSEIQSEIHLLVPVFKVPSGPSGFATGDLWPFLDDGLALVRLSETAYETMESMLPPFLG